MLSPNISLKGSAQMEMVRSRFHAVRHTRPSRASAPSTSGMDTGTQPPNDEPATGFHNTNSFSLVSR